MSLPVFLSQSLSLSVFVSLSLFLSHTLSLYSCLYLCLYVCLCLCLGHPASLFLPLRVTPGVPWSVMEHFMASSPGETSHVGSPTGLVSTPEFLSMFHGSKKQFKSGKLVNRNGRRAHNKSRVGVPAPLLGLPSPFLSLPKPSTCTSNPCPPNFQCQLTLHVSKAFSHFQHHALPDIASLKHPSPLNVPKKTTLRMPQLFQHKPRSPSECAICGTLECLCLPISTIFYVL